MAKRHVSPTAKVAIELVLLAVIVLASLLLQTVKESAPPVSVPIKGQRDRKKAWKRSRAADKMEGRSRPRDR